jgi:hypothetical protein
MLVPVPEAGSGIQAYARTVRSEPWLTDHMAAELGLWIHTPTREMVFVGRPGERVPPVTQDCIAADSEWKPLTHAELPAYKRVADLIRQSLRRYGVTDHPAEPR